MSKLETATSLELERRFLARRIPEQIQGIKPVYMEDTYIPEDLSVHAHLRLRDKDGLYVVTKKFDVPGSDASAHVEHTIKLDESEYLALQQASSRRVIKNRYPTVIDGNGAEVDVFGGVLTGLVLIDFEFSDSDAMAAFTQPDCCLADVTQEEFLAGGMLAGKTYADLTPQLEMLGYLPLFLEAA